LQHAGTANAPKPSATWLKRAREHLADVGDERFKASVLPLLDIFTSASLAGREAGRPATPALLIAEPNATLARGLVWCCGIFDDEPLGRAVGDAAAACFRKIPGVGAQSLKVGNACLWALSAMPGRRGVAQLQRLQQRVKYVSVQRSIGAALESAAQQAGLSRADLEDLSVPTYGLEAGLLRETLGAYAAEIAVLGTRQVELRWITPGGARQHADPAAVKRSCPDELKALKRTAQDIRNTLAAQRDRLEHQLLSERTWRLVEWRARYLDHALLSVLARRLIWWFEDGDRSAVAAWHENAIVGVDDAPLDWLTDEARVRLWHPLGYEPATVLAWRRWLERHGVPQPFKQAHREVYILTDAERQTEVYSNRFAAHLLRQHQLQTLCRERDWTYQLQGNFDSHNAPTRRLPEWGLQAQFWVDAVGNDGALSDHGIYLYVSTDQVRFVRLDGGRPVPFEDVPALVFSEIMRDVDLFVGVCSVGADPHWQDTGPAQYRDYWHSFAFGELTETARTRRTVLEQIVPCLNIAPRCTLTDRFLMVRGDRRTYKIHLGSTNILMEPNNEYLCIVPGRRITEPGGTERMFLPFEGDTGLSVILSKAFLLADDTSISDPTIVSQINRGHRS
jgi:hypothetical protein